MPPLFPQEEQEDEEDFAEASVADMEEDAPEWDDQPALSDEEDAMVMSVPP